MTNRRQLLALLAATGATVSFPARAGGPVKVRVLATPGCGCCRTWAALAEQRGFAVTVADDEALDATKAAHGVPEALASCHTALADGYVFEGHVPFEAMEAVLRDRPSITGLAVPGMPMGSPGMGDDPAARYDVLAFGGEAGKGRVFYRAGTPDPFAG